MSRKLTATLAVLVLAMLLVPQGITAAQGRTVRIPVWHGVEDSSGQYNLSASASVVAHYIWVAQTAQQVEDFMEHADITITVDDQPVFTPQAGKDPGWQSVELSQITELARAQWTFALPALEPGTHTLRTVITLDAEVSDGLEETPFSGVVNETTNMITIPGGPEAVTDEEPADEPAATPRTPAQTVPADEVNCNAVVATFVKEAVGYWAPDTEKPIVPEFVVPAGKSMWTFGMDENHQYYQVLLDEALFWVEADTLSPTADAVWNNAPLPNCVIE